MVKKWRYFVIIAVMVWTVWALIPTVRYYRLPVEKRVALAADKEAKFVDKALKLGLDLQGGMHLVLELDDSQLSDNAKQDALDRVLKIVRNRVDQFGVAEPNIQKQGDKRIIVQLPGLQDPGRAKNLLGQTALLEFRLVRETEEMRLAIQDLDRVLQGVQLRGAVVDTTGIAPEAPADTTAVSQAAKPAQTSAKADTTGATQATAFDSLMTELPGSKEIEVPLKEIAKDRPFSSYLVSLYGGAAVVNEEDRRAVDLLLTTPQAQRVIPRQSEFLWDAESRPLEDGGVGRLLYLVEKKATLTGNTLVNATTNPNPDDPSSLDVSFELNREGGLIFSRFTGENIGRRIAIVLDRNIRSAPVVQSKIPGGQGRITGRFTDEEAGDLAIVLRAGAFPAPVSVVEERTVGPSLGRDSIRASGRAAAISIVIVIAFMAFYYHLSGFLASAAMVFHVLITLALLASLRAALTLPGIAGLILTFGMSVDANVLVFERIREELAKAKTVRSAIDAGYHRAFTTILDSNLTALITALVLYQFGTGPIKGFATTLGLGLATSMFTAVLCTHVVYNMITARRAIRKLSI
jgi:protein-export membrane protein SecD